jgi:hypothetical protein
MDLELYNLASGHKELRLERLIQQVEDPLRNLSDYQDLIDGVIFAGYQQIVSLSESKQDGILSEAWSLIQLNPGGTLLIQASPRVEICDYYEPIDESLQSIYSNHSTGLWASGVFKPFGRWPELSDCAQFLQ